MMCRSGLKVGVQRLQMREQTAGIKRVVRNGAPGEMLPPAGHM